MKEYYDKHRRKIEPGMTIRCTLNGDQETVHANDSDLCIKGAELDDNKTTYHPLTSFAYQKLPPDGYLLNDFEIAP